MVNGSNLFRNKGFRTWKTLLYKTLLKIRELRHGFWIDGSELVCESTISEGTDVKK